MTKRVSNKSTKKLSLKERRRSRFIRMSVFVVILLGIIFFSVIYVLHQSQFVVDTITVNQATQIDRDLVLQTVHVFLDDDSLLLPQRSVFFLDSNLEGFVLDQFPVLESVEVMREGINSLNLEVTEHAMAYTVQDERGYYLSNSEGYIFSQSDDVDEGRIYLSSLSGDEISVRGSVLSQGDFVLFNAFLDDLEVLGVSVSRVYFKNDIETVLETKGGEYIVIDTFGDYDSVTEVLREILGYSEFGYSFSGGVFAQPVDYINLRYGNKILYCYETEPCHGNFDF